ncbi:hypothetical protein C0995_001201 [Termitomyces sp. Mi166|nr:hypothetical protein C0995_001201 [Termitomyces sp. Mi166\
MDTWSKAEFELLSDQWEERCLFCKKSAIQLREEYRKLSYEAQKVWIQEWLQERERRITHGRLCENCADTKRNIKERLTALGWGKEVKRIKELKNWPSVKQPKDLTDRSKLRNSKIRVQEIILSFRVWQNIKDDLIAKMEEHKVYLLEEDYLAAQRHRTSFLYKRLSDLQQKKLSNVIFPDSSIVESLEPLPALIKAPAEETFSESLVLEIVQDWRHSRDTELRNMVIVESRSKGKPETVDPLLLATTIFFCQERHHYFIEYPEIFQHSCAISYIAKTGQRLWNANEEIIFDRKIYSFAKTILEASGLDPTTTTRDDVQWPKFYIECYNCPSVDLTSGKRLSMTWCAAVSSLLSYPSVFLDLMAVYS